MQAVIYGSKSYAKLIAQIASEVGYSIKGFLDDLGDSSLGPYANNRELLLQSQTPIFLGIGYSDLKARNKVLDALLHDNAKLPNLIHPRAYVSPQAQLGSANVVMAMASIDAFCKIGSGNVFWPGSNLSHDCVLCDNTFFSPGSTVCGFVSMGSSTFVGANAVVADKRAVPEESFIKANTLYK